MVANGYENAPLLRLRIFRNLPELSIPACRRILGSGDENGNDQYGVSQSLRGTKPEKRSGVENDQSSISSPEPTLLLVSTKNATSGQVRFSVLNSRTSGYTAQNQRGEQSSSQTSSGLVVFRRETRVGKIGETRRPDQKQQDA